MSHTPGPWFYHAKLSGRESHKGFYVKSLKCVIAYEVIPVDTDGREGEANARLIAAAPEMLEALKGLIGPESNVRIARLRVDRPDAVEVAIAAIFKATGESL